MTVDSTGGNLTSNAGLLLVRECDQRLGLARPIAEVVHDPRDPARVEHSTEQRVPLRMLAKPLCYLRAEVLLFVLPGAGLHFLCAL
ncbi:transposase [Microbulbifer sp. 2304DJ12-6]|uniref:transposase n=1 Tax=Microbulbifer sp. 2304DJ12-6 TaxID=3233340 RepID=UPI0039B124F9